MANQPQLRQESVAEPAGDIILACVGTPVGAQTGAQTLQLFLAGAAITSRQLYTGSAPSNIPTEAALLVNDCTANNGASPTGASCSPDGTFLGGNPTQGVLQGGNGALMFSGFTLPVNPTGGQFQLRITNIRADVNQLPGGTFLSGTIQATFPVSNQQGLVLGAVEQSL